MSRAIDLAAAPALLRRPGVERVLAALDGGGEETRIVGGALRNALLGRAVTEIDLATTALPAETIRRAGLAGLRTVPTGIAHGTVTVLVKGEPFEVTTLRDDVETDGRHAIVRFGRDFTADARRRDFTINALSLGRDGAVLDVTEGVADLRAGRVRFIGEARQRIREDFLRVLRFFRFSAEYGETSVDAAGLHAAIQERDGLDTLSRERVGAEFLKLLVAKRAVAFVALLAETGLLGRLVGGICEAGRLARAVDSDREAPDAIRRLAAALVLSSVDADRLRERLRLSNADHARLLAYGQAASRLRSVAALDRAEARRAAVTYGLPALGDALTALGGEPRPEMMPEGVAQLRALQDGTEPVPVLPLTGADLIRQGVPPGPEIGRRLAEARRLWLAEGCPA